MAGDGAAWLDKRQLFARTVTIKVRYAGFDTVTRSHSAEATRDPAAIIARALALLDKTEAGVRPVRLLGVSMHNLAETTDKPERPARPGAGPRLPFDDEP